MSTIRVNNVFDASGGTTSLQVGGAPPARIVQGTAQASTSGTAIDFTGIPSWAKRVTVMFKDVSTNGTSVPTIQLGAGSIQTTGYAAVGVGFGNSGNSFYSSSAFPTCDSGSATYSRNGSFIFSSMGSNIWTGQGIFSLSNANQSCYGGGSVTLSGTLDRVRITTVNGTDTFDAGSINILYEG